MNSDCSCELCDSRANVFCPSDDACLCWRCDAHVHGANFLVARHSRIFLCRFCSSLTICRSSGAYLASGAHYCGQCSINPCSCAAENCEATDYEETCVTDCSSRVTEPLVGRKFFEESEEQQFDQSPSMSGSFSGDSLGTDFSNLDDEVTSTFRKPHNISTSICSSATGL